MSYSAQHLKETAEIVAKINPADCEKCVAELRAVRDHGGRLFMLGVGGSAANASHAVNDFRKITGIETYAPTDNVSELTARTNDDGWASVFVEWLRVENARPQEPFAVLVGAPGALTTGALSLDEAYALAREHAPRLVLGGVAIAERHARKGEEHLRLMKKQEAGCRFFVTQTVYDASATRSLISDYARASRKAGVAPAPLIFTFSPCGSAKTLELLKWLGVGVPRWLENELLDAHDILETSLELSRATFADVLGYARTHKLPVGANVESVAIRREEIDASVALFQALRAQLRGW